MNNSRSKNFWAGNAILALALIVLLALGRLSEILGIWAMVLWIALVGLGVYLLMRDKGEPPSLSD
ncbi:MAG: hypothetical protein DWQ09_03250 [Proteobacteria bacterium]|nr:MAG: hypothetical protein DWQ09_03250 [Pseudomonadota bacterium]QKK11027.1 MAG: hypothetical protein HND59_04885 [Pseudomonadota bacterium]